MAKSVSIAGSRQTLPVSSRRRLNSRHWRTMHCLLDDLFSLVSLSSLDRFLPTPLCLLCFRRRTFRCSTTEEASKFHFHRVCVDGFAPLGTFHVRQAIQILVLECSGRPAKLVLRSSFRRPRPVHLFIPSRANAWVAFNTGIVLDLVGDPLSTILSPFFRRCLSSNDRVLDFFLRRGIEFILPSIIQWSLLRVLCFV